MLTGASLLSMDAKGRLTIPTRYREVLTSRITVTADPSGCLLLFRGADWEGFAQRVSALPNLNPRIKAMQRLWLGLQNDYDVDTDGRILLTPELRDYAKLDRKVQMVGTNGRFELWSEAGWAAEVELAQRSYREDPPAELAGLSV